MSEYNYIYFWKKYKPERHREPCKLLAMGRGPGPHNMLVEFEDGYQMVTPKHSIRRRHKKDNPQMLLF
jgi:hypothetical protein